MVSVHLAILMLMVCAIVYADHLGFSYIRGTRVTLPAATVRRLHYTVLTGLFGMIATGVYIASDRLGYLLGEPIFILKMCFVVTLVANAFFINKLSLRASEVPYVDLSAREKTVLLFSGVVSFIGWVGAATIGYFFL